MELIHMLSRISDYGIRCGISRKYMKKCSETAVAQILSCSFIADARTYFMEFFDIFTEGLKRFRQERNICFGSPVSEYIEMHYMENIRLGNLAEMIGFSEGHFTRVFREEFGETFVQYYRVQNRPQQRTASYNCYTH